MKNLTNFTSKELTKQQMNQVRGGATYTCTCQNGYTFTIEVDNSLFPVNLSESRCGGGNVYCKNTTLSDGFETESPLKPII